MQAKKQLGLFGQKSIILLSLIWLCLFERSPVYKIMSFYSLSHSIDDIKITAICFHSLLESK